MAYKWLSCYHHLTAAIVVAALSIQRSQAGNTTCVSNQLSWYTSVVGESPCMTYQRLRQICNGSYQVPTLSSKPPGDQCDDQLSSCCCNSIAYHLSMLCMVCQLDTQDSGGIGIDAPGGTYKAYLGKCSPVTNNTLPSNIQSAVCNENIRLDNFLYDLHWWNGDWYYVYTKQFADADHATHNNNTFTHCANQISSTLTSTVPTTSSPHTTSKTTSVSISNTSSADNVQAKPKSNAPLIGGVVGGLLGLVLVVLVAACVIWRRRKTSQQALGGVCDRDEHSTVRQVSSPAENRLIPNRLAAEGSVGPQASLRASEDTSNPSQSAITSTETSYRHYDAGPFMWGPTRPNSGSLPPAYDPSWDTDRARATPNASPGLVSTPSPDSGSPAPRMTRRDGKIIAALRSANQR